MKVFLTESTKHLRRLLVQRSADLGEVHAFAFADGERGYRLGEEVKRMPVTLLASVVPDPASLFDLLSVFRLLRENGSGERRLLVPYLGYARQDHAKEPGEGAIGVMVAELLRNTNPTEIAVFDVHSPEILKALGPNALELSALPLLAKEAAAEPPDVIVAPDLGAEPRAYAFAELFDPIPEIAVVTKVRPSPNVAVAKSLRGNVSGKNVIILDDMIDTGGTMIAATRLVSEAGAMSIRLMATHGIFSKEARERLLRLPIRDITVTNTLPQSRVTGIRVLDVTPMILEHARSHA